MTKGKELKKSINNVCVLLHNIRSVHNVGSIFRTADASGVSKIYLSGYTPAPLNRFGLKRGDLAKVALGAEKNVSWEFFEDPLSVIKKLKKIGFKIIALEQNNSSVDYKKIDVPDKCLIVLGNEVDGVSRDILKKADIVAEIPMKGKKESLNVAVSFGIFIFRILNI